ncbi:hypothetical protein [Cyclobacterium xiamenense]|uniref:hypothetical protein n=1 Tax=Cyclobacterium xiamenense TaxID=1297121 RepID=UPI0012BA227E|nr:hypothetical protein [Cyclobacterium xiamenense]
MEDYLPTTVSITNSDFTYQGVMDLLVNGVANKVIHFKSAFNTALDPGFSGIIDKGPGEVTVESDLPWKMK